MKLLALLGGLLLAGGLDADAGDIQAGRAAAGMCRTCHGLDGMARIPLAPHIGGEPQAYLEDQLLAFKTGSRHHEMMSIVVSTLSMSQIADVAAWYASHTATAALPKNVDPDAAPDACVSCHGISGIATTPDVPHLAGEANIYLDTQLKAFRSGKRKHEIMTPIAAGLSNEQIREYANWYANSLLDIVANE
ncbi:MAG: c-type cytochrome [Aestuariivita sp.]|nr:c-type cytochrome [Aestuariivita sp.]MCY4345281.1 c-type cytochrome [Aestuariivita sp.]